jgi:ribosomal protein L29
MKVKDEIKKFKSQSIAELTKELKDLNLKIIDMKRNLSQDKLKKTSDLTKTRKNIARIKTILREKLVSELEEK